MLQALNLLVANSPPLPPTTWFYFILHPDLLHVEKWRKENNGSRQSYSHGFGIQILSNLNPKWEKSSLTNTNGSPEPKIEDVWRAGILVEGRHTTTQQTHQHPLQRRSEKKTRLVFTCWGFLLFASSRWFVYCFLVSDWLTHVVPKVLKLHTKGQVLSFYCVHFLSFFVFGFMLFCCCPLKKTSSRPILGSHKN